MCSSWAERGRAGRAGKSEMAEEARARRVCEMQSNKPEICIGPPFRTDSGKSHVHHKRAPSQGRPAPRTCRVVYANRA
eukprot:SAG22_NODE_22108_length_251_cov_1.006579_1_plen_77_part_10